MAPTKTEAQQFAIILSSGVPSTEAIHYFTEETDPSLLTALHKEWMGSKTVVAAILTLQGKSWQEMSLDEKIQFAVNKTYTEAAYFLYSHNYSLLTGADRQKADICRQTLESKLAGSSGKLNPLEQFWTDVKSGRIKLGVGSEGSTPVPPKAH